MCGLFAAFNYSQCDRSAFRRATEAVRHRGPDHLGEFDDGLCYLGHTRLSIVGLGTGANQPFDFKSLVLIFNGEIYNFLELRDELTEHGYHFETGSDTEVIIKAFDHWGTDCFQRFNGVWALLIYDKESGVLTVSRDRFGEKPLFVTRRNGTVFLASELHQLAQFTSGTVDYGLIQAFLKEGTYESEGRTFFGDIDEFPKAHVFEFYPSGDVHGRRYWNYWNGDVAEADDETLTTFRHLLEDAVRIRLRSDVQMGVLLSGGVDSSIVAATARAIQPFGSLPAFTYSSEDTEDESSYATAVADRLGIPLTVCKPLCSAEAYRARLKRLVTVQGRGHSSPATVSVDLLYERVASGGIRVALDGQGADELLGGYKTYYPLIICLCILKGRLKQAWAFIRDAVRSGISDSIVTYLRSSLPPFARKCMRWCYGYEQLFVSYVKQSDADRIVAVETRARNKSILNRFLIWQHDLGLSNLLFYGDVVAMKNSVENRTPFTDYRLVDFVFQHGDKLKLWDGHAKYALRRLPLFNVLRDIIDRPKIGFSSSIPVDIKTNMIHELRNSPILHWPIFSKRMAAFLCSPAASSTKYERLLFRLYQVHLWNEVFCHQQGQRASAVVDKEDANANAIRLCAA